MTRSRDLANLADGVEFLAADHSKLDGIETAATADQTDAEIRAAVEAATDSNVFTDADHSKLNAVEASADVTDATNVTAAGALMDSELTNLAAVKAINQSLVTTASPTFAGMATTANVTFGDNDKAVFGAGSDLEIYHQGGYSYIHDSGTGPLYIRATDLIFKSAADNDDYAKFIENGAVELYHSNSKKIETTATGVAITGDLTFGDGHFIGDGGGDNLEIVSGASENILLKAAGGIISFNDASGSNEYARFDPSGNVLVGKQASNSDANGVELLPNGTVYITANNTLPFYINRRGGGTELARFADDGATVGSIGVSSASGGFEIDGGAGYTGLHFATSIIAPKDNGSLNNGGVGLGNSNYRFSDLYLSGGVYLGGTGAANKISEYEIGSWTPVIKGNASGNNATMITADARYTKVGSLLYVSAFLNTINFGAITSGTHVVLTGLPYAAQADYYAPIVFGHNNTNLTDGYVENNGLVYLEINGTETQQSANAITGDRFMIGITMNLNE